MPVRPEVKSHHRGSNDILIAKTTSIAFDSFSLYNIQLSFTSSLSRAESLTPHYVHAQFDGLSFFFFWFDFGRHENHVRTKSSVHNYLMANRTYGNCENKYRTKACADMRTDTQK